MRKSFSLFFGILAVAGCAPDAYRRDADLQVSQIVRDRERQTLSYTPDVVVKDLPTPAAPHHEYAKVPVTPVPLSSGHVLEPEVVGLPWGIYGPENFGNHHPVDDDDDYLRLQKLDDYLEPSTSFGPPNPSDGPTKLDLFRTLSYATQHSREYQTQMEDLYLAALEVTLQRHLFEPRPFANQTLRYAGGAQEDVKLRSALAATSTVGVKQQLPFGGEVTASGLVTFIDELNHHTGDGESASVALGATIPFLRGAGWVNLEPLINSERNVVYAVRKFETYRRNFLVDIASTYFNLVTDQRQLANRRQNAALAKALTERTEALYAAGRLKFSDVQRALSAQISAEGDLISNEGQYNGDLDKLKITLGMDPQEPVEIVPIELDANVPHLRSEDAIKLALQYRLDLQTGRDQVDDARRQVSNAQNGLLPNLNLDVNTAVGNSLRNHFERLDSRTQTYDAKIELDLPIDNVKERNVYRRALIDLQRAQRDFDSLKATVMVAARNALRGIYTAEVRVELEQRGVQVATERLTYANELLRQGQTDSRDVVDAQNSLLDAQDSYDQARAQLQIQVLQYFRDTGTLRIDPAAGALGRALQYSDPQAGAQKPAM